MFFHIYNMLIDKKLWEDNGVEVINMKIIYG